MSGHVFVAGPASWNQIVMLDALPQPVSHMAFARSHRWALGGTSAGKALNLRSLGVDVTLRTVVGDDPEGRQVLMALHESGIDVLAEEASNRVTEQHLNLMDPVGGRVSLYLRSPTLEAADVHLADEARRAMQSADAVVIDLSEPGRALLSQARELGRPVWCDLHDYDGTSPWHQQFVDEASFVFCNDDALPDPAGFVADRISAGAQLAVVTRGAAGAIAMATDGVLRHVQALPVEEVVDTNGAGDAFFAGFLAAHLAGSPVDICLLAAARQASLCIQSPALAPREPTTAATRGRD